MAVAASTAARGVRPTSCTARATATSSVAASVTRKPSRPKTVRAGAQATATSAEATTGSNGSGAVSQPTDSTQPSPPGSPSSDSPAVEPEGGGGQVVMCHVTGSKKHPEVTISVAPAAVDAHLAHGDGLGACAS